MATRNVAAAEIVSTEDETEVIEQQTAGKDKGKKKTAKATKETTAKEKTEKEPAFVWTDDETELLLKVTLEYKVSKAANSIDWESVRSKYADIWKLMRTQLPTSPETAEELGKDYPHTSDEVTKQVVTSKLKGIRLKYRLAVDSGKRSGHGRVVLLYFELCEKIWGGSPATEQICSGIESADLEATTERPDTDVNLPSTAPDEEEPQDTADISGGSEETSRVTQRRAFLDEKLSNYKQEKLKKRLPADAQLIQNAREDLDVKRRLLENMERMDKEHAETMARMSANMDKLTNSIADGFSLLRGLLLPQQTMYPPTPMFGGHQPPMYPPQVHSMYGGHPQQHVYPSQQPTFSGNQQVGSQQSSATFTNEEEPADDSSFTDSSFSSFSPQ